MKVHGSAGSVHYTSTRLQGPKAGSDIEVQIGEAVAVPSELEIFLTARFRLYAHRGTRLLKADVQHQPWPLQRAIVHSLKQNLLQAAGLPDTDAEPLAHFARRVDVMVGWPAVV